MISRRVFATLAAAVLLVLALAGLLAWRAWESGNQASPSRPVVVSALITPQQHLFGDAVRARAELVIDRNRVNPDTVKVRSKFQPYRLLRVLRRTRSDAGPTTRLRFDYLLGCLTAKCLPKKDGRVDFGRATVEYRDNKFGVAKTASFRWPALRAAGRIAPSRLEQVVLRAEYRDVGPPTYRVSPLWVELVALMLAVLFASAALILTLRLLPLARIAERLGLKTIDRRSPLERALALVRESASSGRPEEGRRALERLARELRTTSNPDLARDASRLAWSPRAPVDSSVDPLSNQVERVITEST